MRRSTLPPPRTMIAPVESAEIVRQPSAASPPGPEAVPHETMRQPSAAEERRRRWFHPRTGWFRQLEHDASHFLSKQLYPHLPGLTRLYDRLLHRGLTLSDAAVSLPDLPPMFHGVKALMISDLHAGPLVSRTALTEAIERLMTVRPDLIFVAGDLITARMDEFEGCRDALRLLKAPLGTFAVLGNHDHDPREPKRLRGWIEDCGVRVLHNESAKIRVGEQELSVAGIDDLLSGEPDLDRALRDTTSPVILLSHNPDVLFEAARRDVALVLSGHTHAGQVRIPGLPVLVRMSRYRLDEGRYCAGNTELVVSRGLGAVGIPLRFACSPEAVLLTLNQAVS